MVDRVVDFDEAQVRFLAGSLVLRTWVAQDEQNALSKLTETHFYLRNAFCEEILGEVIFNPPESNLVRFLGEHFTLSNQLIFST